MYAHNSSVTLQKQPMEMFYEKGALRNFSKFTGKQKTPVPESLF